ncbi:MULTISPECIES: glycosyltransferase family 1 protein [Nostocales]|uniref:glycosyltransferase family 4 protein n=1 Tax=Nostocales TaxID=1161 RepID=UPI00029B5A85|nr:MULTISPECIES: glycosyltransferase family 1 protein [Nostocales]AFW95850.1 glycosyl transferase group 1 protein [Anabaena sp. 90]MTJ15660.1 glycosyltransferase family 4 protein [Dolichospermum sp. UHCC 0299]MTJ41589.1 glycosyltransferase family 4 protein [Dolichospermum sp. UHCC 0406]
MRLVIVRREPGVALSMDVYADNLVTELKAIRPNWEIVEVAPHPWSKSQENLWHSGTGIRKYYERYWHHPQQVCQVEGDIYHIIDHTNAHVAYWLKKKGKPIIITCHDLVQFVYPEILKGQSRFPAFSMASWQFSVKGMCYVDCVIAVSSNTAKDAHERLGIALDKIVVVPNGVEASFQPLPSEEIKYFRQKYQRLPEEICLLNVGSTHQRKNIITVLKVLKTLKQRGISVRLWRSGGKFMAEQTAFIKEHNLDQDILDFGIADKNILLQVYNAADVLLAPSLYEGFGLTVLEAMACGLPVITSNISSLPEVSKGAAILVNPMNIEAMLEAAQRIKQDPLYHQHLVDQGLLRARCFSWEKTAKQVAEIYENITHQG